MKTRRILAVLSLLLVLCLGACSAAPAVGTTEDKEVTTEATKNETTADPVETPAETEAPVAEDPDTVEEMIERMDQGFAERAEQYAPEVRELASGVKVQRTPVLDEPYRLYRTEITYNTYVLDADNRGCGACHVNLEDAIGNMGLDDVGEASDYPHLDMHNSMGLEITPMMCMDCHDTSSTIEENVYADGSFGGLMHAIHQNVHGEAFEALGGNCWSCHYASGEDMQLWDEVKHTVLRGITNKSADSMDGEFTWDQSKTIARDDHFTYQWMLEWEAYERWANGVLGNEPAPETDGMYDAWTITVDGEVNNPFTMTLQELIDTFGTEKVTMSFECEINPMGGPLIANSEITGIALSKLIEYADPIPENGCVNIWGYDSPFEWIEKYDGYLMLEIDGKPITYVQGYPVMYASGFGGAFLNEKQIKSITVNSHEFELPKYYLGVRNDDGIFANNPNAGIFHLREGQIFELGKEIEFSGYAHAMALNVTAVELSFDRGATWITLPVENADPTQWVNWYYKWTPDVAGAYVIMARSVASDGRVSDEPVEILFNVQ